MRMKALSLSLVAGLSMVSVAAIAEPAVQAGETLESLSKAKVTTTVNGQPGSIKELVESGKIKLISPEQSQPAATQPTATQPGTIQPLSPAQPTMPADAGATAPVSPSSVATPELAAPESAPNATAPAAMPETAAPNAAQPNAQLDAPEAEQLLSQ